MALAPTGNTDLVTTLYDWLVDPSPVVGSNDLPEYVFRCIGTSGLMHTINDSSSSNGGHDSYVEMQ